MRHVRDAMTAEVITLRTDMSVREAARLLTGHGISGAPVLDGHRRLAGVLSVRDVAAAIASGEATPPGSGYFQADDDGPRLRVEQVMRPADHRLPGDASLLDATAALLHHRVHRILVVDGKDLAGVLTSFDLLRELSAVLGGSDGPRVAEVMQPHPLVVEAEMSTRELAGRLVERGVSGAPVVDGEGLVVGVVSLTDLAVSTGWAGERSRRPASYLSETWIDPERVAEWLARTPVRCGRVADIMSPFVLGVDPDAPVREAVELMRAQRIHRAVVTRHQRVEGTLSTLDLVELLQRELLAQHAVEP